MKKIIERIKNWWFNSRIPYWAGHASLAVTVSLLFYFFREIWFLSGAIIYISREITQYQYEKKFDWRGLLAPVLACFILDYIIGKL